MQDVFQVVALLACSQCYPMQDVFQVVALLACSRHLTPTPAPGPVLMAGVSLNLVCTSSRSRARSPGFMRCPIYVSNTQPLHEANTWGQAGAQTFITRGIGNGFYMFSVLSISLTTLTITQPATIPGLSHTLCAWVYSLVGFQTTDKPSWFRNSRMTIRGHILVHCVFRYVTLCFNPSPCWLWSRCVTYPTSGLWPLACSY